MESTGKLCRPYGRLLLGLALTETLLRARFVILFVPAFTLLLLLLRAAVSPFNVEPRMHYTPWFTCGSRASNVGRSHILAELRRHPGRQLVFVRYVDDLYNKEAHKRGVWPPSSVWEWVYNGANISEHRVVWANDMGPVQNEELIKYYKGRHAWLLEADEQPPKLLPYAFVEDGAVKTAQRRKLPRPGRR